MGTNVVPPKACPPKLIVTGKALKLAEKWVDCMSRSSEDEETQVEFEGRPPRLGLGAKVPHQSQVGPLNDPIERKLRAKVNAGKRKAAQFSEETTQSTRDSNDISDEEDEDDSRTKAFSKRRAPPLTSSLKSKKK